MGDSTATWYICTSGLRLQRGGCRTGTGCSSLPPTIGGCLLPLTRGPQPETTPEVDTPRPSSRRCREVLRPEVNTVLTLSGESIDAEVTVVIRV